MDESWIMTDCLQHPGVGTVSIYCSSFICYNRTQGIVHNNTIRVSER